MIIKVVGYSNLHEINRVLRSKGDAPVICGTCSKPLLKDTKKIVVGDIVYCENDALAAAKKIDTALKDEDLAGRLLKSWTRGLSNVYIYAPRPTSK